MSCPHISHCTTTVHPKERKTLGTNRKMMLPVWLNLINSCKVKSNKIKSEKKFNLSVFHHLLVSFSILSIVCWVWFHLSISMKCVVNLIHVREVKPWERKCASNTHAPNGAGSHQQWDTRLRTVWNSGTSVTPANGQVRKTMESGLHSVAQGHKCRISDVFCALCWFASERTGANDTFSCEYYLLLTALVFSPSRDRAKKGQCITDCILV